jgi:hypothetical protein
MGATSLWLRKPAWRSKSVLDPQWQEPPPGQGSVKVMGAVTTFRSEPGVCWLLNKRGADMGRINNLRGVKIYVAWAIIGVVVGTVLALVDRYLEPTQPLYVLTLIGLLAGLTQAFYTERAKKHRQSS